MAVTPIYKTPAQYAASLGNGYKGPEILLLLEIYNQLYNSSSSDMISLTGTTDGTADFQDDLLIGKSMKAVFVDGILLTLTTDYTVNAATGTITFINIPVINLPVFILYTA
jgi:hypothetical protein